MTTISAPANPSVQSDVNAASAMRKVYLIVKDVFDALNEGMAAHDRYHALRARGVPHAEAASRALNAK